MLKPPLSVTELEGLRLKLHWILEVNIKTVRGGGACESGVQKQHIEKMAIKDFFLNLR